MQDPRHPVGGRRSGFAAVDALLLDGLGTLVALTPPAPALRRQLAGRLGVVVSPAAAERALAAEIAFYRSNMARGRDADGLAALRRDCAEVLRGALPADERLAAAGIDAVTEVLLSSLRFQAYPDARDLLVRARARGIRGVVVSNWDVSLLEVLELVGLAPLLHGAVTSAAVGAAKPAPAIFGHALALVGARAQRALHVGDSLTDDVRGAAACGISAVLLRRDGEPANGATKTGARADAATIGGLDELTWP